jgi:succinylarginine dihydrolase
VVCDPGTVDPRFLVDAAKLDRLAKVIEAHWPEHVAPEQIDGLGAWPEAVAARAALLEALDLAELA